MGNQCTGTACAERQGCSGRHVLAAFLVFFAVVFAVNGGDDLRGAVDPLRRRRPTSPIARVCTTTNACWRTSASAAHWQEALTIAPDGSSRGRDRRPRW